MRTKLAETMSFADIRICSPYQRVMRRNKLCQSSRRPGAGTALQLQRVRGTGNNRNNIIESNSTSTNGTTYIHSVSSSLIASLLRLLRRPERRDTGAVPVEVLRKPTTNTLSEGSGCTRITKHTQCSLQTRCVQGFCNIRAMSFVVTCRTLAVIKSRKCCV